MPWLIWRVMLTSEKVPDVRVLDHVIVGGDGALSMAEEGLM